MSEPNIVRGYMIARWSIPNEYGASLSLREQVGWMPLKREDDNNDDPSFIKLSTLHSAFARYITEGGVTEILEFNPRAVVPEDVGLRTQWWVRQLELREKQDEYV